MNLNVSIDYILNLDHKRGVIDNVPNDTCYKIVVQNDHALLYNLVSLGTLHSMYWTRPISTPKGRSAKSESADKQVFGEFGGKRAEGDQRVGGCPVPALGPSCLIEGYSR